MDLDGANFRLWKFASAGVPFKGPVEGPPDVWLILDNLGKMKFPEI